MKIAVAGLGYVGFLAQYNDVVGIDLDLAKVAMLNVRQSPIGDKELEDYLALKTDYRKIQSVGARIHCDGRPGLLVPSVRYVGGEDYSVSNPVPLSNPRLNRQLIYRLDGQHMVVER